MTTYRRSRQTRVREHQRSNAPRVREHVREVPTDPREKYLAYRRSIASKVDRQDIVKYLADKYVESYERALAAGDDPDSAMTSAEADLHQEMYRIGIEPDHFDITPEEVKEYVEAGPQAGSHAGSLKQRMEDGERKAMARFERENPVRDPKREMEYYVEAYEAAIDEGATPSHAQVQARRAVDAVHEYHGRSSSIEATVLKSPDLVRRMEQRHVVTSVGEYSIGQPVIFMGRTHVRVKIAKRHADPEREYELVDEAGRFYGFASREDLSPR